MTSKERFAALEKSAAEHDRQIKATRDLLRAGIRFVVESNRRSDERMTRIEAALELQIKGRGNGKGEMPEGGIR